MKIIICSYIRLPKELDHPRKGLINIQNTDNNECLKWCLIRYLNPADHHPARITKTDEDFAKMLHFKDLNFPVKIRDIHKIEKKKNSIGISVFGYEDKEKGEGEKNTMFLSMISIDSCMIIHYIMEENIFVVIAYMLSLQKKY